MTPEERGAFVWGLLTHLQPLEVVLYLDNAQGWRLLELAPAIAKTPNWIPDLLSWSGPELLQKLASEIHPGALGVAYETLTEKDRQRMACPLLAKLRAGAKAQHLRGGRKLNLGAMDALQVREAWWSAPFNDRAATAWAMCGAQLDQLQERLK